MSPSKYRVPLGSRIKPSQSGHYNFWYPHDSEEYVSEQSFMCEELSWRGSQEWQAVMVSPEEANIYRSPIRVLWVEKSLFKDIVSAPVKRERLKKRATEK